MGWLMAIDYLVSRDEVDKEKVGITGNSGTGHLLHGYLQFDDRFKISAPSCFITTFFSNLENELPSDNEQCPPGIIGGGLELVDFFIVRALKPVIFLGQKYDFFDLRGLKETYGRSEEIFIKFIGQKII